ncbi:MAG: O-methyltransferase [Bacteroidales bacterium]
MDHALEQYITDHISPEPELLGELYLETYRRVMNPNMLSGHIQGRFLAMLTGMIKPSAVLEIGTYTGYSAICIASALEGTGVVHTIERNDELKDFTGEFISRSGLSGKIIMHTGDATDIIPGLEKEFDMVFIDGDKREYADYYRLVIDRVRKGGYIIADNVLWDGKVADPGDNDPMTEGIREFNELVKSDPTVENTIVTLRDGLMIIRKL